eukprot:1191390-Prorocentrum_minimum.AAC.3
MDKVARKVRTTVDDSHSNGPPQRVGKVSGMVTNVNLFTRCSSHHVHIVLIGTPGVLGANCYIRIEGSKFRCFAWPLALARQAPWWPEFSSANQIAHIGMSVKRRFTMH